MAKVLIADDAAFMRMKSASLVKQLGHEVIEAENGEQAVALYEEHSPDAVLLDMTLPGGLSGLEVAKEMLRLDSYTNIVATSGYFEEGASDQEELSIFSAILPKPYSVTSLSEAIESALVP